MTSIDSLFSGYLKTENITTETTLTIDRISVEAIRRDGIPTNLPVVYFKEIGQGLILNKVNADCLAMLANSKEIESWSGMKVTLYKDNEIYFNGAKISGIRIKAPNQGVLDKGVV